MHNVQKNGSSQKTVHETLSFLSEILIEEQQSTKHQYDVAVEQSMFDLAKAWHSDLKALVETQAMIIPLLEKWNAQIPNRKFHVPPSKTVRGTRGILTVDLDGEKIAEINSTGTFIKTLRKIGLERIKELNLFLSNAPLISNARLKTYHNQRQVGDYFVNTHSSTASKKALLEKIGRKLKMPIDVRIEKT